MSDQNNKSGLVIVAVVVALALAAAAYFFLAPKADKASEPVASTEAPADTAAAPTEPIVPGEVPPQPETPQNVVVETKQLEIPGEEAKPAEEAPAPAAAADIKSSPDVAKMMGERSIGNQDAPIKVTEYSSLTCSHCAHFHKDAFAAFKAKFVDTGRVELIFKEFPLNPPALDASMILRCMPEDKFVSFMTLLFETQDNWAYKPEYKDILRQNAKLAGMSDESFDACLANTELKERIVSDMKAASDKYKIQSTPSFVVNDGEKTVVGVQPLEFFEKTFGELKGATPAAPAPAAAPAVETPAAQ